MRDTLTWAAIAAVIAAYLAVRHNTVQGVKETIVNAQLEVDPTRWRHTGVQPTDSRNGNGPLFHW